MATYTPSDREKEELRKEALRDTQAAEERERLQKKARDDQHKRTIQEQIRKLEIQLETKVRAHELIQRDIDAAEYRIRKVARTSYAGKNASTRELEDAEREVKEVTRKLEAVVATERTLKDELARITRKLVDEKRKNETVVKDLANTKLDAEQAARDKRKAEQKATESKSGIEAVKREINVLERELLVH